MDADPLQYKKPVATWGKKIAYLVASSGQRYVYDVAFEESNVGRCLERSGGPNKLKRSNAKWLLAKCSLELQVEKRIHGLSVRLDMDGGMGGQYI